MSTVASIYENELYISLCCCSDACVREPASAVQHSPVGRDEVREGQSEECSDHCTGQGQYHCLPHHCKHAIIVHSHNNLLLYSIHVYMLVVWIHFFFFSFCYSIPLLHVYSVLCTFSCTLYIHYAYTLHVHMYMLSCMCAIQ